MPPLPITSGDSARSSVKSAPMVMVKLPVCPERSVMSCASSAAVVTVA
ncbi:MAG: hypothetical protein J0H91_02065 [Rhodospirillales bacterium]|nr:hypothetical protein [Rhodospirillales bacterium]